MAKDLDFQVNSSLLPVRERVGLIVDGTNAATAVKTNVAAEAAGVRQIWMVQSPFWPDALTTFAVAAAKTSTVSLGTSIAPNLSSSSAGHGTAGSGFV